MERVKTSCTHLLVFDKFCLFKWDHGTNCAILGRIVPYYGTEAVEYEVPGETGGAWKCAPVTEAK
jgi:hypothetical protein